MPMNFFTPQTIRNIWGEWGRTPPEPGRPGKRQTPRTPLVSRQTLPEASGAVSVQRAAAEHGEILNGQKALRTGTGAIHQECFMHPGFQQPELFRYVKERGIVPIGYCPIGSPSRPERDRTAEDVADTQIPIPFSVKPQQYLENLRCAVQDPLTEDEMERIRRADKNCRLIKGQVFLWPGADGWEDLWDMGS